MPPVCAGAGDTRGNAPLRDSTVDDVQLLQSQLADWLTHAAVDIGVFSRKAQRSGDEAIILQADVIQMSYDNPCLAASIMNSPEYLRACLIKLLVQQGLLPSMLHRLWLRPVQVPLPLMNPYELQQLVTHGCQPQPVRFQGICTSVSTVTKQVYARHVRCCFCDAEGDHLEGHAVSCCIGRQQQPNGYEEDLTCRQYVPVQQIWVGALHPVGTKPFTVREGQVLVQLLEQDLCTAVTIGDVVDIVGQASVNSQPGKADSKLLGDAQVMASSLSLVQLSSVEPVLGLPTHWNRDRLLNALCNSLEACLTYPMSHDLMLTLLLSAVSAGVPVTPPTQTSGTTARNQVHVMVTSVGHDPCLTRTLQEAAEALSGLHAVHSPSLSPLLPEVVKLEKQDAAVEPAAVRILGGSLASNNKGILLLNSIDIKKADRDVLGSALNKGHFEVLQAPSVVVPATAAVWAMHSADSLARTKPANISQSVQDIIQRSVSDLGLSLFCAFDLMLPHAHSGDSDAAEACIDSILNRTTRDQPAAAVNSGREHATGSVCSRRKDKGAELRHRVAQGASMAVPCITPEAMMMIQCYYALLRQQGQGCGQAATLVDAGTHTVASLLRMATACARLHLRNNVMAMPDAVLAIYLLQESMRAKGAKIIDQLDMSSSCNPYFSQSQHLPLAMVNKLEHMHEFLTDYMRHTAIEQ
ncbi:TPA: hypothetical protein ACH3X2_003521 [Trebouxia sp. C0005]